MANNTGLRFNPLTGLGGWRDNQQQQSVPTVAEDYMNQFTMPIPEWKPERLQKARTFVADVNSGKFDNWNPMEDYDRWQGGLRGLSNDEQAIWESQNYAKILDQSEEWRDRLWRNQQFVNTFGMERFQQTPDKNERDRMYEDYLLGDAIGKKYGSNSNLEQLMSLTPEGKKELLNSDYKANWQLKQSDQAAENKDWEDYTLGERWNAVSSDVSSYGMAGLGLGTTIGAAFEGVGSIPGAAIGGLIGAGTGLVMGVLNPEDAASTNAMQRRAENDDILNKITVADNERKKVDSQDSINDLWSAYTKAYSQGQITSEQVDEMFDNLALSGKRTATDKLGNTQEYDYHGSNYYTMFKDEDEFEHFGTVDKLKYIAQSQVLGQKYGQGTAINILEQDMQNYVSDNQSSWQWAGNSLKNVWVGGVANLANNVTALGALSAKTFYGEEGLAEYLKGKDASGDGTDNWFNPQYWNKVDQYNTFDTDAIAKADQNGGISIYNNVVTPGTEGDFWSWNTLNEAVRMNKFAWSDLLKNLSLGRMVRGATRLAGGVELAPGVLATESPTAAQAINKVGALGVMNASSLGIDAAYGMQTYEEVLRQNNEKLDQIIDKDTETEVQRRLQTKEAQADFRRFVDTENARRKARAGERGSYIAVDEDKAFVDYTEYLRKQVRQEQEALHQEDRQQAENDAANAYAVDASIEHLRMATTNGVFKSYLFDKGTLNAIRKNNPYVATTTKNGQYALAKNATRNAALKQMGVQVWGGFHSNYFDDVTVGFAEGFGLQDYNNYLLQKYNPAAYGAVIDDYVNPFVAGIAGATNAMTEKRSFLDGGIGALGSFMTVSPNVNGMISHRQRMKELAEANKKQGTEKQGISTAEWISDFVNNPVLQAVADAKQKTRMTEAEIKRINDIIKESGYSLDNIVETASALNQKVIAREGTSLIEAEDAKDREAFALASTLLSLRNSGVVANAQAEPNKANWSRKKRAAATIGRGFNMLLGVPMFNEAESSYTNAMQSLQDAASIGETSDEATVQRQQELVNTFLGLDQNKNVLADMSEEEKAGFAQERLKKNAANLLDIMDRTEKLQKKFENSIQAQLHPDLKQQLMYQYVLDNRWKIRLSELEEQITGEQGTPEYEGSHAAIAKYGSMQGHERTKKAQEKRVQAAQTAYDKAAKEADKENDPTKSIVENARQKAVRMWKKKTAAINLKKEQDALSQINNEEAELKSALESEAPVITADQILRLNPNDRYRMLDDFYRNDYSEAQQREIDLAKNKLIEDGTSINEAMEKVKDAAILSDRIQDNMEVAKRIMQNPVEANQMQQAVIENRRRAIIDYFNDKIVAEAFNDFQADPESTLSKEKIAQKAHGYSTAVLNGMLRAIEKELARARKADEPSDKTLSTMEDGIKEVLGQRDEQMKETVDLDSYIRKTKSVPHTEVTTSPAGAHYEQKTGDYEVTTVPTQVTTDRDLSENDKKLLDYAIDYAAERGIPVDELSQRVQDEDFNNYVEQRNHAYELAINPMTGEVTETNVATVDNRANQVSPEYMSGLVNDVVDAFKANKDKVAQAKADKPTAAQPESVATNPVETKGSKAEATREEEVRPDEVDPNDPFGLKKKKTASVTQQPTPRPASPTPANSRNAQIMEDASTLNSKILEDVGILLDEVDKLPMQEQTRDKLKDIISANLNSRTFGNIQELQNRIMEDAMVTSQAEAPQIDAKATALAGLNIGDIKSRRAGQAGTEQASGIPAGEINNNPNPLPPTPLVLESRDLDMLMNYPVWKSYIEKHGVIPFLQKLSDAWNKEAEAWRQTNKQGLLHQSQVVFLYDPALAEAVKNNIEENGGFYNPEISSPILMALEVTDKNKHLVDSESQLISIKDKTDGKTKQYQVIGVMPSSEISTGESDAMKATAARMSALRNRINFNDTDTHVLRYAPQNDTGKYNGTPIRTNIEKVSSHTEEDRIPHATEETPRTGVQQLMDENLNSATESFISATEEEQQAYDAAKQRGLSEIRKTNLYKKLRKAFIDRLFKRERKAQNPDDPNSKELNFNLQKGTNDTYPKIVLVKKVSETLDKNTGRPIIDILRETDGTGSNAQEVIESNSRFRRLFNQLSKLKLSSGLFNAQGDVVNRTAYDKAVRDFEESVRKTIDNNLHVDDMTVRVDITEGRPDEKTVHINVYSGDVNNNNNLLTTLTTSYTGQVSQAEYAPFLKDLILDNEGNTRSGLNDSRYERVKWQVNYEDAETAHDSTKTPVERKAATDNLNDLYDDGIFEMQVTKLAYPSRSITVSINPAMKAKLYPERTREPEAPIGNPTGIVASFEAESAAGKVDGDTGMMTEAPTREGILNGIPRAIMDTINRMLSDSKSRQLTDDGRHYSIGGQLWSRVTSIKYALENMGQRFNPANGWALPSSLLGNSLDEFGRDVFTGAFDSMDGTKRMAEFEGYDNSTAKNYDQVFMALKAFESRLAGKGQVVIATGNRENPGHITAKGTLDVQVKGEQGIETKKVRVAGTLDVLAIDDKGNLHIYDFKTHRGAFDAAHAVEKGYDRQLSMYAKFLEDEYGLKVKSINIIPIKVDYPTPSGRDNEGNAIQGAQKTYKQARPGSNQLEVKEPTADDSKFEPYRGANFQVEAEFPLTRLDNAALVASFDRMSDAEKEAIVEAIQDQSESPATTGEVKAGDIASAKPDIVEETAEEEEEGGFSRRGSRFGLGRKKAATPAPSAEETAQAINPEDKGGLLNRLKDLENACGGPKKK